MLNKNYLSSVSLFLFLLSLSFATDIARGMAYLHQHKIFHGRLHSRNCVVDDRWVCKISGKKSHLRKKFFIFVVCHQMLCMFQKNYVSQVMINTKFLCDYTDYGLMAYRKEDSEVLSSTFHCGDLCRIYSAPEVLLGNTSTNTAAADVYR